MNAHVLFNFLIHHQEMRFKMRYGQIVFFMIASGLRQR